MGFEPTTAEFRLDALTDWAIRPWGHEFNSLSEPTLYSYSNFIFLSSVHISYLYTYIYICIYIYLYIFYIYYIYIIFMYMNVCMIYIYIYIYACMYVSNLQKFWLYEILQYHTLILQELGVFGLNSNFGNAQFQPFSNPKLVARN